MLKYLFYFSVIIVITLAQTLLPEKTLDDILNELQNNEDGRNTENGDNNNGDSSTGSAQTIECDNGVCVAPNLCNTNNTINLYGSYVIDDRFSKTEPKQCHYLETCCEGKNVEPEPIKPPSRKREGCGNRYINGTGITNVGNTQLYSQFGEFPWMVAILLSEKLLDHTAVIYKCGGSIIHPQVILTAAHCVKPYINDVSNLIIRAGEWDTQTKNEPLPTVDRNVVEIVVHPNYYKPASFNDIAILYLNEPFDLTDHIQTICLPPQNTNFDDQPCITSGWGKDKFESDGKYQNILKKVELPVISRNVCQTKLRGTRLSHRFNLHESFICAGGKEGIDTCKGDGGSPLICPILGMADRYYQAGIVAWGIGCNRPIPGVYANVALFKNWIDQQLNSKFLETKYYTP